MVCLYMSEKTEVLQQLLDLGADASIPGSICAWTLCHLATTGSLMDTVSLLSVITGYDQLCETSDCLMGWVTDGLQFWLQATQYLEGLPSEYYVKSTQMRRFSTQALEAMNQESQRRKIITARQS